MPFQPSTNRLRVTGQLAWSLLAALTPVAGARAETGIAPGSAAVIAAGQPVLVRVSPGWDAAVAYELADGSPITVWDAEQPAPDGSLWYPIDGGFVPADSVASLSTDGTDPASQISVTAGADATKDPATGDEKNSAPDAATLDSAASNGGVTDQAVGGGSVSADAAPADSSAPVVTEPLGQPIGTATITNTGGQGAACRAAPDPNAATLAVFGDGNQVDLRGDVAGDWAPVNCAGAGGYIASSLLSVAPSAPPTVSTASLDVPDGPKVKDKPAEASASLAAPSKHETGDEIADFALQYRGYPYVYAGEGPYAFDCSGFTMFVIHNTLGIDIPHDMTQQYAMGQEVSRDALQPGDLVFFANTDHPGMSHDGIYIGRGKFVHAENEGVGVKVSELDDPYYSPRWYGAVRFAK